MDEKLRGVWQVWAGGGVGKMSSGSSSSLLPRLLLSVSFFGFGAGKKEERSKVFLYVIGQVAVLSSIN